MLKFVILLACLCFPCDNPFKLIYTNGTALAIQQESLLVKYQRNETISKDTLKNLKRNWWVYTANQTTPCNLVIRHYCLIDLFSNKPKHQAHIERQLYLLSGGNVPNKYRGWAEGYSYWLYTKQVLKEWLLKYPQKATDSVKTLANNIDSGFALTAYYREFKWFPVPYGDLFDVPLDSIGQVIADHITDIREKAIIRQCERYWQSGDTIYYQIYAFPVGLNGHTETINTLRWVVRDTVYNFKFYAGYSTKYTDIKAEWKDLLNPKRIFSAILIW